MTNFVCEDDNRITLLMLSWRDILNPKCGGAEVFTHEIFKRLDRNQYRVIHFSPTFDNCNNDEVIDGIRYLRQGNIFSVILYARRFYLKHHKKIDIVFDQCNTHRFFTKFWVKKDKRCFLIFQLTRELWNIVLHTPFAWIGRWLETPMLKMNRNDITFTESQSVKSELLAIGFKDTNVHIIPIGLAFPAYKIEDFKTKETGPVFIYVGRFCRYKGINDLITAFGEVKRSYSSAKLWIVGKADTEYFNNEMLPILSQYSLTYGTSCKEDVTMWGFVEDEVKLDLMSKASVLLFPSKREGWGMIVTEAAAVGTPSIVYNSTGCVDAVNWGQAGYLCEKNMPSEMARLMIDSIEDKEKYSRMRLNAYLFSHSFQWENSAQILDSHLKEIVSKKCSIHDLRCDEGKSKQLEYVEPN